LGTFLRTVTIDRVEVTGKRYTICCLREMAIFQRCTRTAWRRTGACGGQPYSADDRVQWGTSVMANGIWREGWRARQDSNLRPSAQKTEGTNKAGTAQDDPPCRAGQPDWRWCARAGLHRVAAEATSPWWAGWPALTTVAVRARWDVMHPRERERRARPERYRADDCDPRQPRNPDGKRRHLLQETPGQPRVRGRGIPAVRGPRVPALLPELP